MIQTGKPSWFDFRFISHFLSQERVTDVPQLSGQLLIASEEMIDPNFAKTVVLLVQHSAMGAMGVVINRPTTTTVSEAWKEISGESCSVSGKIHAGGPCEGMVSVLHNSEEVADLPVLENLYFSTNKSSIEKLVQSPPDEYRFMVGYAGWGPGQLEGELGRGDWLLLPANSDLALSLEEDQWERLLKKSCGLSVFASLGIKTLPIDPSLN